MSVMLLPEYQLDLLSSKGGCTGLSESTLVKIPHCWKSHVAVHMAFTTQCGLKRAGAPISRPKYFEWYCILVITHSKKLALLLSPDEDGGDIVLASSVRACVSPSALFVCPEPYLNTYWSDLIHCRYK